MTVRLAMFLLLSILLLLLFPRQTTCIKFEEYYDDEKGEIRYMPFPSYRIKLKVSATLSKFHEDLLTDRFTTTFTCVNGVPSPILRDVPWIQLDIVTRHMVTLVEVVSPTNIFFAQYTNNFRIDVLSDSLEKEGAMKNPTFCAKMSFKGYIPPMTKFAFECEKSNFGRYVLVQKIMDETVLSRFLVMAEVSLYVETLYLFL